MCILIINTTSDTCNFGGDASISFSLSLSLKSFRAVPSDEMVWMAETFFEVVDDKVCTDTFADVRLLIAELLVRWLLELVSATFERCPRYLRLRYIFN